MNSAAYLDQVRQTKSAGTHTAYRYSLRLFESQCRKEPSAVTGEDLLTFAEWRRKQGDAERTIHNHLLRTSIFLHAAGSQLSFAAYLPKAANRIPEEYSIKQVNAMLNAAREDERLILEVFLCAGVRNKELANLEKADIDFEASTIRIRVKENWRPKNGQEREIAVPRWLTENLATKPPGVLFRNSLGKPNANLLRTVKAVAARAGMTGRVDCHKFRSTAICQWLRSGYSLQDTMAAAGHNNLVTVQHYLAVANRKHMQEMSERAFAYAISGD
jgi:integrase